VPDAETLVVTTLLGDPDTVVERDVDGSDESVWLDDDVAVNVDVGS
jgi:hypothetical protein